MSKLAIFDLDGVLIDSREANYQAFAEGIEWVGGERPNREEVTRLIGLTARTMLERLGCPRERCEEAYEKVVKPFYLEHLPELARPVEGAQQVLQGLKERGYRIGACTSGDSDLQERALRAIGVREFIEEMQTPDTSLHRKPDVEYLGELVDRLGPSNSVLHVEDSEIGLKMGLEFGAITVFADYGYGTPGAHQPHHRIQELSDLLQVVDQL